MVMYTFSPSTQEAEAGGSLCVLGHPGQPGLHTETMSQKNKTKYSTSLAISGMQIKTNLRFHLASVRIGKINKTSENLCWQGWGVSGTLIHC